MANNKKIQVETIKMTAEAEVIALNASFVAKAMRAQFALNSAMKHMACGDEDRCKTTMSFLDELVTAMLNEDEVPVNQAEE